jgi:two-component system, cell cycle sensor histidine kinase and response regulator CckA
MLPGLKVAVDDAQYRRLFETLPHGVVFLDEYGGVKEANPAAERILGLKAAQMKGRALWGRGLRLVREDSNLGGDLPVASALPPAQGLHGRLLALTQPRQGRARWVSVEVVPQKRPEALHAYPVCLVLTDVTAQHRVQERLREEETRFRLLTESSTEMVSRHAADGRFLYVSPTVRSLLGYEPEALTGQGLDEFLHPDDREVVRESQRMVVRQMTGSTVVYRFRTRSGGYRWLETTHRGVPGEGGEAAVEIQATSRDVTAYKEVEQQLRKLSVAVEQSPASVVITDPEGRIEYVNAKFEQVTGYTREEVLGQNPRVLKSGCMCDGYYRCLWETIRAGNEWRGEFQNRRKNGEHFWEQAVISPIKDEQGRVSHFLAVKEDITERKLADELRARLETQLRESQKLEAFGQLAGGVAHDFNNILTVVQSHACLLQEGQLTESERAESVREIARSAERAANLTAQLLAFSRRQLLQRRDLDLNDILTAMTRMLQRLIGEHIRFQAEVSPQGAVIHADAGMMEQVILNLVVNARDAMPRGGTLRLSTQCVKVRHEQAKRRTGARPGSFVRLSVVDTGCGIAPEHQERIFEPFFTTKEVGKGTGLGLATVLGIVEQHQGWVEVESEFGAGTTFHVYLPRIKLAVRPAARMPVAKDVRGGSETILVVEDEAPLRILVRTVLERQGYSVLEAENGRQALGIWEQHRDCIQLLLTDMVMPEGISGIELAQELQAVAPSLRVVFSTGYNDQSFNTAFRRRGNRFLPKPYDPVRLARTVRECLDDG